MKWIAKISGLLHVLILFSFLSGFYNNSILAANIAFMPIQATNGTGNLTFQPADLYCHDFKTENFSKIPGDPPVTSIKNPFNKAIADAKTAEIVLLSVFSRYNFYSKNIIIRFQPEDITFPFQYFW